MLVVACKNSSKQTFLRWRSSFGHPQNLKQRSLTCIRVFQDAYVYKAHDGTAQIQRVVEPFPAASPPYGYGMRILMEAQQKNLLDLSLVIMLHA